MPRLMITLGIVFLSLSGLFPPPALAADHLVRVGVLAHRGKDEALKPGHPPHAISGNSGYNFVIVPLNNDDIGPAVEYRDVEFVLTNRFIMPNWNTASASRASPR